MPTPFVSKACTAAALAILATAWASWAQAEDIRTPSGTLSLDLPPGYTRLADEELKAKFGRAGRVPLAAWGNARRTSTVAVTWSEMKQAPLTADKLPEFKKAMEQLLPRLTPGLQFRRTDAISVGAYPWLLFDSTAPAFDTEVRNHMYLTHLGGHMVGVNYNATVADYPQQKERFEASAKTLAVRE